MDFYYYPKCSTCIKALNYLKEHNIDINLHDMTVDSPNSDQFKMWFKNSDKKITAFLNTSGIDYRKEGWKDKFATMSPDEIADILGARWKLARRPILSIGESAISGFKPKEYDSLVTIDD